ncbi:hypothetical protein Tco_0993579 [Tanacetum coccineum]
MEGIEDMIPKLESQVKVAYDKDVALRITHWGPLCQLFYRAQISQVSTHDVFSLMKILSVVSVKVEKKFGYGYLEEIIVRRADQNLYKFKEGDFPRLHLNDIKYMLLLLNQHKIFNLYGDVIVDLGVALLKEPYTLNFDPKGVIYKDKQNHKRLMHADELYKFIDGTLTSVYKTLHYRLLNLRMGYNDDMPKRKWIEKDQFWSNIMVNLIDKQLLKRRIMRSLEVLVGRRKTETDRRLLQRTV